MKKLAVLLLFLPGCQPYDVIGREVEPGPMRGFLAGRPIVETDAVWSERDIDEERAALTLDGDELQASMTFHRGLDDFDGGRVELFVRAQAEDGTWVSQPPPEDLEMRAQLVDEQWDELASVAQERWLITIVATWPSRQEDLTIEILYDRTLYYPPVEDDDGSDPYYDC